MFKKSLWLILLIALGGFFFSTSAYSGVRVSASEYGKSIDYCGATLNDATAAYGIFWSSALTSGTSRSHVFTGVVEGYKFSYSRQNTDGTTSDRTQTVPNTAKAGGCDESTFDNNFDPQQELQNQCMNEFNDRSYWHSDNIQDGCFQEQPGGDSDSDGVINELDPDSGLYDPNFCTDNPSHSDCSDDGDGDGDGSGGDDGGGDDGGSDLPSTCEGDPTFSESCCRDHAEAQCLAKGGLHDWGYISVGTPSCNYTCNDDVTEPDPDPTPDPDTSDIVDSVNDASNNIASQISDSEAAITGQIAQQTDELGADINSLETTNQSGFDSLNTTNQNGFDSLTQQLEALKNGAGNPDTTFRDSMLDSIEENTKRAAFAGEDALSRLDSANAELRSINEGIGSLNDALNGDIQNDDSALGSFGDGAATGADAAVRGALESQFGDLNKDLPNEQINLSDEADKFDPMLNDVSGSCSSLDESFNFRGKEINVNLNPVCDVFDVLSYFVIAAALFAVPFIVLGVSKK